MVSVHGRALSTQAREAWFPSQEAGRCDSRSMRSLVRMLASQALNNLSSEDLDYQVRDRLSFTGCMGLGIDYSIPDVSTV
jgi:hypothetical protein